jgi:phosphoesterase RecJ-like protein
MIDYQYIVEKIKFSNNIVITSHKGPDGDAIGSSLALFHFIKSLGKNAVICIPDEAPHYLTWIEGSNEIIYFDKERDKAANLLVKADLLFCLDYNAPERVGKDMMDSLQNSSAYKILVDHHINPVNFCDYNFSDTRSCSTAQLIFEIINGSDHLTLLNEPMCQSIYMGIVTDTGSFRFPSVEAKTHEIIAILIKNGLKHYEIHEKIFDTNTLDKIKLRGFALAQKMEIVPGYPIAIISLTRNELQEYNYQNGDTDGLVNMALSIQGINIAAFFTEREEQVKISFRSKGDYYVNLIAMENFSGGGHKYAAGGVFFGGINEAIESFKKLIPNYF